MSSAGLYHLGEGKPYINPWRSLSPHTTWRGIASVTCMLPQRGSRAREAQYFGRKLKAEPGFMSTCACSWCFSLASLLGLHSGHSLIRLLSQGLPLPALHLLTAFPITSLHSWLQPQASTQSWPGLCLAFVSKWDTWNITQDTENG